MTDNPSQLNPPPVGDSQKAETYLMILADLISSDKLTVTQTDMSKFPNSPFREHYRINLQSYDVEISHSINNEGKDSYVILFTNANLIKSGQATEAILAYAHLTADQFNRFKIVAQEQIRRHREELEEKRFKEAMQPIDQLLEKMLTAEVTTEPAPPAAETQAPPPPPAASVHQPEVQQPAIGTPPPPSAPQPSAEMAASPTLQDSMIQQLPSESYSSQMPPAPALGNQPLDLSQVEVLPPQTEQNKNNNWPSSLNPIPPSPTGWPANTSPQPNLNTPAGTIIQSTANTTPQDFSQETLNKVLGIQPQS